ncbi:hypothetical protein [Delftia tsuruhatensis]|uniref:hypothetical protein n=1 Tax=Delftia tsuruhatensis TaxID=180282 RepID=UPI001F1F552D|nr:hypothetical protein [Delftia tsuruhatensis]
MKERSRANKGKPQTHGLDDPARSPEYFNRKNIVLSIRTTTSNPVNPENPGGRHNLADAATHVLSPF